MTNSDLVDIQKLAQRLHNEGASAFNHWAATAREIARDSYHDIERVRRDYSTLAETELYLFRYESFIHAILDAMPTLDTKKKLLEFEALHEKKF